MLLSKLGRISFFHGEMVTRIYKMTAFSPGYEIESMRVVVLFCSSAICDLWLRSSQLLDKCEVEKSITINCLLNKLYIRSD